MTTLGRFLGRALVALALLVALAPQAMAVGTVTLTSVEVSPGGVAKYTFAWTSDAAGAVSGNAKAIRVGNIIQAQFIPGSGGTQPTDLYDATFVEASSVDLLIGAGANLSNATSKIIEFHPPYFHDGVGTLDLVIANAGNAKTGTFVLWVRP